MAAIDKRSNGRWRVRIRNRRAPALSKTFTRKADAIKWARDTEILIEQGHFTQTDNKLITLKNILLMRGFLTKIIYTNSHFFQANCYNP